MVLLPAESGEFIVQRAKHITVSDAGIEKLTDAVIKALQDKSIDAANFSQNDYHPTSSDSWAVEWIFVVDCLNFCFWTPGNRSWRVKKKGGYFALCNAINRAKREGYDITNANFYSTITQEQIEHIFRPDDGQTVIPLLQERLNLLHQVGEKLIKEYDGKFENCVTRCSNSAVKLLQLIATEFPSFKDEAEYAGKKVSFYKRAQILIGDLWACFRGEGIGHFHDIEEITMFADYRVPQVLVHFKALKYSEELWEALKCDTILPSGDEREVEIRGASIYIVEQVKNAVKKKINNENLRDLNSENINSILLDHFLWDYRRIFARELYYVPFHKVICIFY